MTDEDRLARRGVFGEVADTYDRHRPGYPDRLFDDVVDLAQLRPGSSILEIGAGTGKATREWSRRQLDVLALEPDHRMASLARRQAADDANVEIVEASFEDWQPDHHTFSLVAAAQSWHWVDPAVAYGKAVRVLDATGWLALFWNYPVDPGAELADPIDEIYARLVPDMRSRYAGNRGSKTDLEWEQRLQAGGFDDVIERSYSFDRIYSTDGYVSLLRTHSDHRLLEARQREELLTEIAATIDAAGGELEVTYECRLYAARPAR